MLNEEAEAVWSCVAIPNKIFRQVEKEDFGYKKFFTRRKN
jgi:hypothetical protein